ncbi:serine/threonine-protein kinase [Actinoplanes friuliensis]|uniref:non-specific serine/threonine protein kinase n=1 Tax=Actinoplanes friuliensis DSM 7358 TaxID=1246995 RepID=U5VNH3_9ACTN|nr:serine/threonine-protein kinase [Actinoplanes friuliensis]AGZ38347.1 putative serine/threonine protein kinase [Actinoplanes friuliensis DSM 7358]
MISPGVTLGGRYRLDERIAGGGMGDVWRGTDEVLGRTVAVKILLPALLDEPGFAERFRGEARTMATINHPGVVDVYDYGSDQQLAFLVMEYVEGDALSRTLSRVGRLTPARTMALVAQAADALQAAHANGIVHRDVKPGNLLVRPNGTLVLTDFGIARSAMVGQLTVAGSVLGTASYISPEQASGAVATAASDVYALGVVAYQCLSGHRPFDGSTPIEIAMKHVRDTPRPLPADIPQAVRAIVDRALAKDPGARWPTASAMAAVARQAASSLTTQVQQPAVNGSSAGRPQSGGPTMTRPQSSGPSMANRPHSGAPTSGPGGHPMSGQGRPPYPPIPRPVSGAQARGAASVPPAQQPYRHPSAPPMQQHQPMQGGKQADGSGGRQVLIVLAVVLALLVLLCAGVISFLLNQGNTNAMGDHGNRSTVVVAGSADQRTSATSYRLTKQAAAPHSLNHATEGRQTL